MVGKHVSLAPGESGSVREGGGGVGGVPEAAPEGRASVIMAISFCCWDKWFCFTVEHAQTHERTNTWPQIRTGVMSTALFLP